jgi:hypothetical protein
MADTKDTKETKIIKDDAIEKLANMSFADMEAKKKLDDKAKNSKEALKLVRCQISCNNKNKTSYSGEIFSARNAVIDEVKKFIPFNVPTHVPQILLNMIKEKQVQMFKKEKLANGAVVTRSYLAPEYNIQILPPLTPAEFEAIKQKQLAEGRGN